MDQEPNKGGRGLPFHDAQGFAKNREHATGEYCARRHCASHVLPCPFAHTPFLAFDPPWTIVAAMGLLR